MFDEVFEKVYTEFKQDYGNLKFDKIKRKIINSKHTKSLVSQCKQMQIVPNPADLRGCVLSNLTFAFSKKATEIAAMTIVLQVWHREVNMKFYLLDKPDLENLIKRFDDTFTY